MLIPSLLKQKILEANKNTSNTQQKKIYFLEIPKLTNLLASALADNSYKPSKFSCFTVRDPEIREVFDPSYRNRIVQHLIIDSIGLFIDKKFIFDSYANRKKGSPSSG